MAVSYIGIMLVPAAFELLGRLVGMQLFSGISPGVFRGYDYIYGEGAAYSQKKSADRIESG